jgi:hypothetical protein
MKALSRTYVIPIVRARSAYVNYTLPDACDRIVPNAVVRHCQRSLLVSGQTSEHLPGLRMHVRSYVFDRPTRAMLESCSRYT